MEILTFQDTQSLQQGIQKIYSLHDSHTFGIDILAIVNQFVPSEIPSLSSTNLQTAKVSLLFQPDFSGLTPEMENVIHEHFGEHPIVQNMPQTLTGAYKISDFLSTTEFHRLEGLYQQYLGLFDIEEQMTFFLPDVSSGTSSHYSQPKAALIGFALNRLQRNFTERDRLILNFLRPHLAQSYANIQHYKPIQQDLHQLQQSFNCLGLVVLDADICVQSIAPQAALWLKTYFTSSTSPRHLPDHLRSWIKHQITNLTAPSELPKPCPPLRIQLPDRELTIRLIIEQIGSRYLLLLEEQALDQSLALEILGLSQRETELLNWVMQGKDNQTIAKTMGITIGTVRKHLENLYRKLGVTSRAEAIAHTLGKLGLLNSLPLT
jgi:DNA-binding CsgD family transcriptional regulator